MNRKTTKEKKEYCSNKFRGEADVIEHCTNNYYETSCNEFFELGSISILGCIEECKKVYVLTDSDVCF